MSAPLALSSDQITGVGVGVIIALIVIGALLSLVITALVGRVLILAVVVVLGVVVWQQRSSIENDVKKCHLDMSFVGIHVNAPKDVQQRCNQLTG